MSQYDEGLAAARKAFSPQNVLRGLPEEPGARKATPITTGVLDYFPAALAEIARISKAGNDQHNPGQPLHWSRGKSADHADCIARHLIERGTHDTDGLRHSAKMAWRALALLQEELEAHAGFDHTRTVQIGMDMARGADQTLVAVMSDPEGALKRAAEVFRQDVAAGRVALPAPVNGAALNSGKPAYSTLERRLENQAEVIRGLREDLADAQKQIDTLHGKEGIPVCLTQDALNLLKSGRSVEVSPYSRHLEGSLLASLTITSGPSTE